MDRFFGNPFIHEPEPPVVAYQLWLAGQNQALSPLFSCIVNGSLNQQSRIAFSAAVRNGIDAKDHLPRAVRVVPFGMVVHLIREVALIRHEAVDEREDFSARISLRRQQPEMVGVMREPSADALGRRPLGGQIRRRLNGAERLPVIFRCMSDSRARFHSFA